MPLLLKTIRAWRCLAAIPPAAAIDNSAAVLDKLQDEGIAVLGPADRRHATTVVSRAFAGTPKSEPEPMADWILGPALADYGDPRREELLRFFLAFEVLNAAPQCRSWWHALMPGPAAFEAAPGRVRGEGAWGRVMLGARGPGGELEAVVIAQRMERPPAGITAAAQKVGAICRFAWSGLGALPTVLRPALYARVGRPCLHRAQDIALPTMDALHAEHSAGGEHWYVAFMAVDPAAQGRGHCGRLTRARPHRGRRPPRLAARLQREPQQNRLRATWVYRGRRYELRRRYAARAQLGQHAAAHVRHEKERQWHRAMI
mmetsp:Transcript_20644/g.55724  ORF Transcript_20644/g.55724 Transcript_20644/m.55724 type:complete len:316 (-) Transcript_20644:441-1388(-)